MKKNFFFDLDGTLAEWRLGVSIEELYTQHYFDTLKPTEDLCAAVNKAAMERNANVYVLSAYIPGTYALEEKKAWCAEHLPNLSKSSLLFVPCGTDKASFIKNLLKRDLTENDILIDDYSVNIQAWETAGGIAIKWLNGVNNTTGKEYRYYATSAESIIDLMSGEDGIRIAEQDHDFRSKVVTAVDRLFSEKAYLWESGFSKREDYVLVETIPDGAFLLRIKGIPILKDAYGVISPADGLDLADDSNKNLYCMVAEILRKEFKCV